MRQKEPIWLLIIRVALALVFIFSGFMKAIDPVASALKFDEYFISFGMGFLHPISMFCAVIMNILELVLGFMLLFRVKVKLTSLGYLLFMGFFFLLTLWLAVAEHLEVNYGYDFGVVKDCGCFGQAIEMSNLETFLKNVVLLALTLVVFLKRKVIPDIRLTELGKWTFVGLMVLAVGVLQFYCYRHLPLIDFSDWKKGKNVAELFVDTPAQKEMIFIYRNNQDGTEMTLTSGELMDITDKNPLFYDQYDYVDRKDSVLMEGISAKIHGFNMLDSTGSDHTSSLLNETLETRVFILFMPDLEEAKVKGLASPELADIVKSSKENEELLVGITNSSIEEIEEFRALHNISFPIYTNPIDPLKGPFMVRDAIRSNPGLIVLQKGVVQAKWAWRDIPEYAAIR